MQQIAENHWNDADGNPAGGATSGVGIKIDWQDGPLRVPNDDPAPSAPGFLEREPNGAFVEGVIRAAIGRLQYYQSSKFRCRENALAITKLEEALHWLDSRTRDREAKGVEGTHGLRDSEGRDTPPA